MRERDPPPILEQNPYNCNGKNGVWSRGQLQEAIFDIKNVIWHPKIEKFIFRYEKIEKILYK
jgi:hypothetical protein